MLGKEGVLLTMRNKALKSVALVAALGLAVLVGVYMSPLLNQQQPPNVLAAPTGNISTLLGPNTIADVAESVSPAVVFIEVEYKAQELKRTTGSFWDDFFSPWFTGPSQPSGRSISQGSGFIISADGRIVTNQHVVDNDAQIKEIRVYVLNHKEPYVAKLIGKDITTDLAVLKIEPKGKLAVATLGDSDKIRVGEFVVAIGNPYGQSFDHTVTVGVLSAKGRQISITDYESGNQRIYRNLMQTDAAINPGNSGGPLLNLNGEVVGINTAVRADSQGIGFAIPINLARNIISDLLTKGEVVRPWIGIEYEPLDKSTADYLGLSSTNGILIRGVYRNSPASKGGLQPGDVVVKVNGKTIKNDEDFQSITENMKIGDKLTVIVQRSNGQQVRDVTVLVTVGKRPDDV
jgi:serine protease Do